MRKAAQKRKELEEDARLEREVQFAREQEKQSDLTEIAKKAFQKEEAAKYNLSQFAEQKNEVKLDPIVEVKETTRVQSTYQSAPRIDMNQLEEDMKAMRDKMFRKAYNDVKNGFDEEMSQFKKDLMEKNRLMAMELENLKDRATMLNLEKNKNEQELINLNREILLKKDRDDEQLRRLYIALDRTNPDKHKHKDYSDIVPLDRITDGREDPFEKAEIVWWKKNPHDPTDDFYKPGGIDDYDLSKIQRMNFKNGHRLGELNRIEEHYQLQPDSQKKDRLDQAMMEFIYDGPSVAKTRRGAQDALRMEQEIVSDIENLVHQIKLT